AGIVLAVVALAANIPYTALIMLFDYDDVLRRPAGEVLTLFSAQGTPLILAWWGFALGAVGLAIGAALVGEALKSGRGSISPSFTMFCVLSGVLQAAALLRWTFAIPPVAAAYIAAAPGSAESVAAVSAYQTLNSFAGVAIGEHLGQILLMVWTLGLGIALVRNGGALKWIGIAGLATLPAWIAGQSELLSTVMPELPVIEVIPYAFMGMELWLFVLGVALVVGAMKRRGAR
ncbi:MAG: DUF4386 domain-containing protein, partial [Alphaproteobacteria bacterium]|nr:DUF4386 domain-containing protein [Alphaproteobacteria bacterium]